MGLAVYRQKRQFDRTPEPAGARARARTRLTFVVQKHAARSLHYDFRLELDGVLLSWAVPKGPSTKPGEKRLAVEVEDHPIEYGSFEGRIPAGQYGAGTVEIWDSGTWMPEGDPRTALKKGSLHFSLAGKRLKGRWNLVRMKDAGGSRKPQWLLIKSRDENAPLVGPDEEEVGGTRRDTQGRAPAWAARTASKPVPRAAGRGAAKLPEFIEPQLATAVDVVPAGDDWLHEIKYDGYRIQARLERGEVELRTRSGLDWTERFPGVAQALGRLKVDTAILDGEVTVMGDDGVSHFRLLQDALGPARKAHPMTYFAFDLLHLDGRDLTKRPLEERKAELRRLLPSRAHGAVRYSDHAVGAGGEFHAAACARGLEGIISKRRDATWSPGRSREWVKGKCRPRQEFVIGGWTDPQGGRSGFGSLLLGAYAGRDCLEYVGRVGTGFGDQSLRTLLARLSKLERTRSPFTGGPKGKGMHWVQPKLVAEVSFATWTSDGLLRQSAFEGLREDKPASRVKLVREPAARKAAGRANGKAKPAAPSRARRPSAARATREETAAPTRRASQAAAPDTVAGVRITHPERVVYAAEGICKLDLARYLESVADRMLPHVAERPLMVMRCPDGVGKACFYQKHPGSIPGGRSDAARPRAGKNGAADLVVRDLEGLIGLVQNGVVEIHTWGALRKRLAEPDRLVFDLDPHADVPWKRIVEIAGRFRRELERHELPVFVKTTGGRGLHLFTPLDRGHRWDGVKQAARRVAERLLESEDDLTLEIAKAARTGKVFVDTLRNGQGATCVAPWSPRARAGATISRPLDWKDLSARTPPERFTVAGWSGQAKPPADPWRDWEASRARIPAALTRRPAHR